jgi:hypothetical protein
MMKQLIRTVLFCRLRTANFASMDRVAGNASDNIERYSCSGSSRDSAKRAVIERLLFKAALYRDELIIGGRH